MEEGQSVCWTGLGEDATEGIFTPLIGVSCSNHTKWEGGLLLAYLFFSHIEICLVLLFYALKGLMCLNFCAMLLHL